MTQQVQLRKTMNPLLQPGSPALIRREDLQWRCRASCQASASQRHSSPIAQAQLGAQAHLAAPQRHYDRLLGSASALVPMRPAHSATIKASWRPAARAQPPGQNKLPSWMHIAHIQDSCSPQRCRCWASHANCLQHLQLSPAGRAQVMHWPAGLPRQAASRQPVSARAGLPAEECCCAGGGWEGVDGCGAWCPGSCCGCCMGTAKSATGAAAACARQGWSARSRCWVLRRSALLACAGGGRGQ